jgi:cell division transport system permease protein
MTSIQRAWRGGKNDWRLHALSVFSVSVAFVCLAAALLVVVNVTHLRDAWARSGRATVFLKAGAPAGDVAELERALGAVAGVKDVRLVSGEAARRELVGATADPVLGSLPPEAFPASLEVWLDDEVSGARLEALRTSLGALPAVEAIETYEAWTQRLDRLLSGGVAAAGLLAAVVFAAVVSVVASTIRLTLQRRRLEVEVLRLIGATSKYVRAPFIVEGTAQGAFGALSATLLLGVLYWVALRGLSAEIRVLLGTSPTFLPWQWVVGMVAVGGVMGALAAFVSLRRLSSV